MQLQDRQEIQKRKQRIQLIKKIVELLLLVYHKGICVPFINFLPLFKRVTQFLKKGKLFLEKERRERVILVRLFGIYSVKSYSVLQMV